MSTFFFVCLPVSLAVECLSLALCPVITQDECEFVCRAGFFANYAQRRCCTLNEVVDPDTGRCACAPGFGNPYGSPLVCSP